MHDESGLKNTEQEAFWREERARTVSPRWTWVIRGSTIAFLVGFIGFYVFVHEEAVQATVKTVGQALKKAKDVFSVRVSHSPTEFAD